VHDTPIAVPPPWNLGVLLSGTGRTLENLLQAIARRKLDARVRVVISSVPNVRGLDVAREAGIPAMVIRRGDHDSLATYSDAMYDALAPYDIDLIVMAGYLRKMLVYPEWEGRILNIHPALLPDAAAYAAGKGMFGERVHAAVLAHGDMVSGCTVHLVTDDYDAGPPLARAEVPVLPGDTAATLGSRVFATECHLYPATIARYMREHPHLKRSWRDNRVPGQPREVRR
jgi:formyltetrahydrofolate-dependent phosphoribosylglycinamide formyltransferase